MKPRIRRRLVAAIFSMAALIAGAAFTLAGTADSANAATSLACDIYAAGGTPCIGAHSTTRALFAAYNGPLYQVQRASDKAYTDVGLLAAGGYANAATQDSFCASTRARSRRSTTRPPTTTTCRSPGAATGRARAPTARTSARTPRRCR